MLTPEHYQRLADALGAAADAVRSTVDEREDGKPGDVLKRLSDGAINLRKAEMHFEKEEQEELLSALGGLEVRC